MFFAANGMNAMSPPWAQITAYDLNTGDIKWKAPLGVVPSLAAKGITDTGNNYRVHRNGPVVTAGGLIFIAHFADRTVRAFDKDNGKILWEKKMTPNFAGIPAVYEVNGRQFVAFYGSNVDRPGEGNIAWEGGAAGLAGVLRVLRCRRSKETKSEKRKTNNVTRHANVRALLYSFSLFTFHFLAAPLRPPRWPQFRGPTGQGHSSEQRPSARVERNAERRVEGAGPRPRMVVAGHRQWTGLDDDVRRGERAARRCARSRSTSQTGRELLNVEVFRLSNANLKNPKNSHASPTPIVEGDRVYVHFGGDGTAALDASSGAIVWAKKFPYASQHGSGGSPALHGDLLIFSGDGHYEAWVIALDKRTGDVKWKTERRKPFDQAYTTPLVISVDGRDQVVSVGAYRAAAYDAATGREIWMVRYEDGFSNVPRPVFAHGLVYITTGFFQPAVLAVRPDGTGDVTAHAHRVVDDARRAVHAVAARRRRRAVRHQRSRRAVLCRCEDRQASLAGAARRQPLGVADLRRRPHLLPQRRRGRDGDCAWQRPSRNSPSTSSTAPRSRRWPSRTARSSSAA